MYVGTTLIQISHNIYNNNVTEAVEITTTDRQTQEHPVHHSPLLGCTVPRAANVALKLMLHPNPNERKQAQAMKAPPHNSQHPKDPLPPFLYKKLKRPAEALKSRATLVSKW